MTKAINKTTIVNNIFIYFSFIPASSGINFEALNSIYTIKYIKSQIGEQNNVKPK